MNWQLAPLGIREPGDSLLLQAIADAAAIADLQHDALLRPVLLELTRETGT